MRWRALFIFTLIVAWMGLNCGAAFSQDEGGIAQIVPGREEPTEGPELQWVWGEVVSVDAANNQLSIRYLDYETDAEKEMLVGVDDKTTYENAKAVAEIKPQDTVSIDYVVSAEGKNTARNISVEKPDMGEEFPEAVTPEGKDLKPVQTPPEGAVPAAAEGQAQTQTEAPAQPESETPPQTQE